MSKIKLSPSGKIVSCESGQTVLAALEKNGYMLPNNCRAGACGECKIKVLKGTFDQGFILDMALSAQDRAQGYGLMCMAKPTCQELELEFATENALPKLFPPEEMRPFMLIEKRLVTATILKLVLHCLISPMRFWPGQYVMLGKNGLKRSYSVANIPNAEGEIILYVTKMPGGEVSTWIHEELKEGETLYLDGPYGTFIGDPRTDGPVLCLAAGSGLAPIMSLAKAALTRGGFRNPATIIFSARTTQDIFDKGHFAYLEKRYRNFRFIPTLTGENKEKMWHGRIPDLLGEKFPDLQNHSVYIAGPVDFVEACKLKALALGLQPERLYLEAFHSQ